MTTYTDMTDEQLQEAHAAIEAELTRRQGLDSVYQQIENILDDAQHRGLIQSHEPGGQWQQPTGAHDAYRRNDTVTHNGKTWVSTVTPNVWEPGVSGWREKVADGGVPEFVQPTGAHDAYQAGDQVTWDGEVYTSLINGNVWSPTDNPQGWEKQAPGE